MKYAALALATCVVLSTPAFASFEADRQLDYMRTHRVVHRAPYPGYYMHRMRRPGPRPMMGMQFLQPLMGLLLRLHH